MSKPTCASCRFFQDGICRRRAPIAFDPRMASDLAIEPLSSVWPEITDEDYHWCGEHEPGEGE